MAYGTLCFVLLLMAMAYGNNLVFIVCFFLTVMGMRLAQVINNTVASIDIDSYSAENVFAENDQKVFVTVTNTGKKELKGLEIKFQQDSAMRLFNIAAGEVLSLETSWSPKKRGYNKLPNIHLSSSYPGELFRAWKVMKTTEEVLVYPERKGRADFPESMQSQNDAIGVLREIRDYKPGDSPKRIHWRSLAKNGQLRTMLHEGNEGKQCHFTWAQASSTNLEEKLSQLALWIHLAESQSFQWSVKLPTRELDSDRHGDAYKQALTELALWKGTK